MIYRFSKLKEDNTYKEKKTGGEVYIYKILN